MFEGIPKLMEPKPLHPCKGEHDRLQTLLKITRTIATELNLDNLLKLIMDEVREALHADRCTVFLVDIPRKELWSKVAHGIEPGEIRFPATKGIAGYVAMTGEVLNIPDCYKNPHFNPEIDIQTGYRTRSMLTFPMRNKKGEIIGVFQVLNKLAGLFTHEDEEMLSAISIIASSQIENAQLYEEQEKTFESFVETLASTIDARDPLTAGHSRRIKLYADEIARLAGLSPEERKILRTSALLHDVGKIGVRENVLTKGSKLTEDEYEHIKSHVVITRNILSKIHFTRENSIIPDIASTHHEKLDGSGYPDGLKGNKIPLGGKILAIADVFDALTSIRHYRDRMDFSQVLDHLNRDSGTKYDSRLIRAFEKIRLDRLIEIIENTHTDLLNQGALESLHPYTLLDLDQVLKNGEPQHKPEFVKIFENYYYRKYIRPKKTEA
ncbi:cyclic di-GMP phosphodiesterase response regulator RpfG [bacterium BMS3Abin05]|nr:cyclic di-GMP phosphodiesterase response regulator RpfG [bacterium BMS3Abin05]GBE26404.1 cyclic di-GMP phosphodiesterase response regulator RpfG [bacterium BMS3Bbin03]HDZ12976.1 GAF domain-containing protein [Bacteroidota bacterium]